MPNFIKYIRSWIASGCLIAAAGYAAESHSLYRADDYLKNYALSVCIAKGYNAAEVKNDAAAAARGYNEFGGYSLAAHTAVRKLADDYLARHYDSQSGEPMTLAKCIDLYHSKELDSLLKQYRDKKGS